MSDTKSWINYKLPKSIRLKPECLDQVIPIQILGIKGTLHLPGAAWGKDDSPYLEAPSLNKLALAQLEQYNGEARLWGSISSWHRKNKTFDSFSVGNLLVELELNEDDITYSDYIYGRGHPISTEISKLGKDIDEWFEELCLWVAVKTKQDMNYIHPLSSVNMPGHGLQVWTEEADKISLIASRNFLQINTDKDENKKALGKIELEKIISAISSGRRPPESHIFLRDARDASMRNQMRKAIIDAGTAVEITLRTYAITNGISIRSSPPATLGWYVHHTAPNLPHDTQQKLVDVRNDATHYNSSFNSALVPAGINTATQIIETLEPLVL